MDKKQLRELEKAIGDSVWSSAKAFVKVYAFVGVVIAGFLLIWG